MTLKQTILDGIINLAQRYEVEKVVLFGSRANDTCWERSDIDLAIPFQKKEDVIFFREDLNKIPTLLMFDVVNLNSDMISLDLRKSIQDEGVVIYEKIRTT